MKLEIMDEFLPIPDGVAVATSQELAKTQGILTGISGGATMWAAIETAKAAGVDAATVAAAEAKLAGEAPAVATDAEAASH